MSALHKGCVGGEVDFAVTQFTVSLQITCQLQPVKCSKVQVLLKMQKQLYLALVSQRYTFYITIFRTVILL